MALSHTSVPIREDTPSEAKRSGDKGEQKEWRNASAVFATQQSASGLWTEL